MKEFDRPSFEEQNAALEQDPFAGRVFLNSPIPAVGQMVDVPPDKSSNNFENIIDSIR